MVNHGGMIYLIQEPMELQVKVIKVQMEPHKMMHKRLQVVVAGQGGLGPVVMEDRV